MSELTKKAPIYICFSCRSRVGVVLMVGCLEKRGVYSASEVALESISSYVSELATALDKVDLILLKLSLLVLLLIVFKDGISCDVFASFTVLMLLLLAL